jgi:di/tricarboxylate transporter
MSQLVAVLALLAAAIALFALNRPRFDVVALMALVALPFTGVLTMAEALAGFSDQNVVLIAALFVLGDGLVRTGVAQRLGDWLIRTAGPDETRLTALLMVVVCGLGATMSSTAVTAIFIPVALRIARNTGIGPGRLMMPLSVAALISGMITLVATAPNLVVNAELERHGIEGFRFFSFTPFGLPVLVLGIVYMSFARRWLGEGRSEVAAADRPSFADWIAEYHLANREVRLAVPAGSPLVGQTLAELKLRSGTGAHIVAVERHRRFSREILGVSARTEIAAGDILLIHLVRPSPEVETLRQRYGLEALPLSGRYFADRSQEIGIVEAIVLPTSDLLGRTVRTASFRSRYGLTAIGLRRGDGPHGGDIADEPLATGDALLLVGTWKEIGRLRAEARDLAVVGLPAEVDEALPAPGRAFQAVLCLGLVVLLMISGALPNVQAALIGCLLMGALGCVDLTSAYRAIDWKTIVLIAGMLPFSLALERVGAVELAARGLLSLIGGVGAYGLLAALFVITATLGMFISNTATAVLMAPVAMIVALAASTAFMTPVSSPVNTLVVTPGNYTFGDFLRVGLPLSLLVMVLCVVLVPRLLPL